MKACFYTSSFLFILALGGLANQETAKKGNWYGIYSMALAIFITFFTQGFGIKELEKFAIAFIIGGLIGLTLAIKVILYYLLKLNLY